MKSRLPKLKNTKKLYRNPYLTKHTTPKLASYRDESAARSGLSLSYKHDPRTILQAIEDPHLAQLSLNEKLLGIRQAKHGKSMSDAGEKPFVAKHIMVEFAPEKLVSKKNERPNILFNHVSFHD